LAGGKDEKLEKIVNIIGMKKFGRMRRMEYVKRI
jgi:hypothetical protein